MIKIPCGGFLMIIEAIFLALLVLFSLLGFWSFGKTLIARFALSPCQLAVTLELGDDIELLRLKIREVRSEFCCRRHRITVLIPASRAEDIELRNFFEEADVDYLFFMEK